MRAMTRICLVVLFLVVAGGASGVLACTCMRPQTVDIESEKYHYVAVFKLNGFIKPDGKDKYLPPGLDRGKSVLTVARSLKGDLRVGQKVHFRQGYGGMCGWSFGKLDVGREYLFYLGYKTGRKDSAVKPAVWDASICSPSGWAAAKIGDIAYLVNYEKVKGKTRVSGVVGTYFDDPKALEPKVDYLVGHKVTIRGNGNETELTTDANGFFEIYDLLPGKYSIEVEPVEGYTAERGATTGEFELEAGRHVELNFTLTPENKVRSMFEKPDGFVNPILACPITGR